jgi:hypothetical protein
MIENMTPRFKSASHKPTANGVSFMVSGHMEWQNM